MEAGPGRDRPSCRGSLLSGLGFSQAGRATLYTPALSRPVTQLGKSHSCGLLVGLELPPLEVLVVGSAHPGRPVMLAGRFCSLPFRQQLAWAGPMAVGQQGQVSTAVPALGLCSRCLETDLDWGLGCLSRGHSWSCIVCRPWSLCVSSGRTAGGAWRGC